MHTNDPRGNRFDPDRQSAKPTRRSRDGDTTNSGRGDAQKDRAPPEGGDDCTNTCDGDKDSRNRTDGGQLKVCPECDVSDVQHRGQNAEPGATYRCPRCGARFDSPVIRDPYYPGTAIRRRLEAADPDDLRADGGRDRPPGLDILVLHRLFEGKPISLGTLRRDIETAMGHEVDIGTVVDELVDAGLVRHGPDSGYVRTERGSNVAGRVIRTAYEFSGGRRTRIEGGRE